MNLHKQKTVAVFFHNFCFIFRKHLQCIDHLSIRLPFMITYKFNLKNANLKNSNLKHENFTGYDLKNADLSGSDLRNADFTGADLRNADLSETNLFKANFRDAILSGIKLCKAFMIETDFSNVNFSRTDLSDADLRKAKLNGANLSYADLRGIKLSEAELSNANFSNAILTSCDLSNMDLNEVNFSNANLSKSKFCNSNLRNANLQNADLSEADLSNANLEDANLEDAILKDAIFKMTRVGGAVFKNAAGLPEWTVQGITATGSYSKRKINMAIRNGYKNLRYADLSDANFTKIDLSYADLREANLNNARLCKSDLRYADLSGAVLKNADLSYSDLQSAIIKGTDFSNANMAYANVSNIIFSESNIQYADFKNANLLNTIFFPGWILKKIHDESESSIAEMIKDSVVRSRETLKKRLFQMNPYDFEFFISKLLKHMGYENIHVTPKSNDYGVDLTAEYGNHMSKFTVAVQAKIMQGNISRTVLDQLRGSLGYYQAEQGIIITTGDFAKGCKEAAELPGQPKIRLINGEQLLDYLFEYGIGIKKEKVEIHSIDEDFFDNFNKALLKK